MPICYLKILLTMYLVVAQAYYFLNNKQDDDDDDDDDNDDDDVKTKNVLLSCAKNITVTICLNY